MVARVSVVRQGFAKRCSTPAQSYDVQHTGRESSNRFRGSQDTLLIKDPCSSSSKTALRADLCLAEEVLFASRYETASSTSEENPSPPSLEGGHYLQFGL
jgi:hypothetical protein